jgi:hypothetical protein
VLFDVSLEVEDGVDVLLELVSELGVVLLLLLDELGVVELGVVALGAVDELVLDGVVELGVVEFISCDLLRVERLQPVKHSPPVRSAAAMMTLSF